MADVHLEYWRECILTATEDAGIELPVATVNVLAEAVMNGHENYGQAFYQPPASDRLAVIKEEHARELAKKDAEHREETRRFDRAIRRANGWYSDVHYEIDSIGCIRRFD